MITSTTKGMKTKINQFLNYAATPPNATLKYIACNMCLRAHSDASYLCEPKAQIQAGSYAYLRNCPTLPLLIDTAQPSHNGAIHIVCKVLNAVMSSA